MGLGFKYHVVTVAAIFFALTVGLVVGSLLLSPKVVDRQGQVINDLRKIVAADFKANKAQRDIAEKALAAYVPAAIKGKLHNSTVAIVQTGSYSDGVNQVKEVLEQADAKIVSITKIDREMDRPDEVLLPALVAINKSDLRFPTDRTTLAQQIATIISHGDISPLSLEPELEHENYLHTDASLQFKEGASYCIIVAGTQSDESQRVANVDQPLIAALQKQGVTVIMCEPSDAHASDVEVYRTLKIGVSTVDNIDQMTGHGALVFAIGSEVNDFGIKVAARALFPPELTNFALSPR